MTKYSLIAYGVTDDEMGRVRDYDTQMIPIEQDWARAAALEAQARIIKNGANQSLAELQQPYSISPSTS